MEMFYPDFPQFFHMSGFEDVRMSGCPDIETLTRDLETFFVPRVNFEWNQVKNDEIQVVQVFASPL